MTFLWPWALTALLIVPLLLALYLWMLRRKQRYAVRYSSLLLVRAALPRHARWRRHLPFALFLTALAGLAVAMARPQAEIEIPLSQSTIMLAIDVSRSMCATDVAPNRLTIAQEAARAFVEDQPDGTQIGIVAFTGFAETVVAPTDDKEALVQAIDNFTTAFGTAIGSAILESIDAVALVNEAVAPSGVNLQAGVPAGEEAPAVAGAGYQPDIIVLLTDGANAQGPRPLDAAQQAADRRLRVYTIGFGTIDPGQLVCTREQLGSDVFGSGFAGGFTGGGGGGGGDWRRFVVLDEETLRGVADLTGGAYYQAKNAEQLLDVFLNLPANISLQKVPYEISVFFTALAALLAIVAVSLSLRWNRFP